MGERTEKFLRLSTVLTGFRREALLGTGVSSVYLYELDQVLPSGTIDELLLVNESQANEIERQSAIANLLDQDPKLGEVVQRIILLWYTGAWTPFSDAWRAAYGTSPHDTLRVISTQGYKSGFQWDAAQAHPAGALQEGFGSWSAEPRRRSL